MKFSRPLVALAAAAVLAGAVAFAFSRHLARRSLASWDETASATASAAIAPARGDAVVVPLARVLAAPRAFDGRRIEVTGIVGCQGLFASARDYNVRDNVLGDAKTVQLYGDTGKPSERCTFIGTFSAAAGSLDVIRVVDCRDVGLDGIKDCSCHAAAPPRRERYAALRR